MAWLAKDIEERELIFDKHPYRSEGYRCNPDVRYGNTIELPKGSIKKLIGRELSWSDDPVEI